MDTPNETWGTWAANEWQAVDDAVYTPWEAGADAADYVGTKLDEAETDVTAAAGSAWGNMAATAKAMADKLPYIAAIEGALGVSSLAIATGGAVIIGGGTLYLLSNSKNVGKLIDTLNPAKALKGIKIGL